MIKSLTISFIVISFCVYKIWQTPQIKLKYKFDICFAEDKPGASDSIVTYTPYKCSDKNRTPLSDGPLEGPWAEMKELIVIDDFSFDLILESDRPFFNANCIVGKKSIWRYHQSEDGKVTFKLISETETSSPC